MGFEPLGSSCSLALKILSCHVNGGLLAWYLPFLLRGEGTWIALAIVDFRVLPLLSKITYIYIYIYK